VTSGGSVSGWSTSRGWAAALAGCVAVATVAAAQGPASILTDHGVQPVDPPAAAADFTLPSLSGAPVALSELHGQWVLLTFFASWCGPCRSEMPSLERLHRARAGQGLAVVGVSTDAQAAPLERFVADLGLSFTILHDSGGRVAAAYRATSIPLSYLIDPSGQIVGVSRGARDWSRLEPMVEALLAAVPADPDAPSAYAASAGAVELPPTFEPPTADVALAEGDAVTGSPFQLDVHLRWAGSIEDYLPMPPQVSLPDGVSLLRVSASTSSAQGSSVVTYQLTLEADQAGSFALDPVELRYTPRGERQPMIARVTGPTVVVRPRRVAGLAPRTLGMVAGGVLAAAALGLLAARRIRARRGHAAAPVESSYARLRARFESARLSRLQGDTAACLLVLAELGRELGLTDEGEADGVQSMVEQVRYGGQAPPAEDLDRSMRRIERRLESLRPDTEQNEREVIRLAGKD